MALLTRDQILSVDDRTYATVAVPEWGGSVKLRTLTGKERDRFEASLQADSKGSKKKNMENFRARLVALCAVGDDNRPMFTNSQDVIMLGDRSVAALQRLFNKCNEMNGLTDEDIEELTEDFEEAPAEASTTSSPSPSV